MSATEVESLQQIVDVMETMDDREQERTVVWLMHRYTEFINDDEDE